MLQYQYEVYNPGQYKADVQAQLDQMVADGWQVHTAAPNYSEIAILWQRELPKPGVSKDDAKEPSATRESPARPAGTRARVQLPADK